MKREKYKGQFDSFETPTGMRENIEKGLDEKKKKRNGLIWWKVAAGILILVGVTFAFTLIAEVNGASKNRTVAHNGKDPKRNVKPGTTAYTLNKQQLGAKTRYHDSLRKVENGTNDIQLSVKEKPVDQNPLNGPTGITTAVPFLIVNGSATTPNIYNWSSAGANGQGIASSFGSGGGPGRNGSGVGKQNTSDASILQKITLGNRSNTMFTSPINPS